MEKRRRILLAQWLFLKQLPQGRVKQVRRFIDLLTITPQH
jgi:hypothetical protein